VCALWFGFVAALVTTGFYRWITFRAGLVESLLALFGLFTAFDALRWWVYSATAPPVPMQDKSLENLGGYAGGIAGALAWLAGTPEVAGVGSGLVKALFGWCSRSAHSRRLEEYDREPSGVLQQRPGHRWSAGGGSRCVPRLVISNRKPPASSSRTGNTGDNSCQTGDIARSSIDRVRGAMNYLLADQALQIGSSDCRNRRR